MSNIDYKTTNLLTFNREKLKESLFALKKELLKLRFQKSLGELVNTSRFLKIKKNIARIQTELVKRSKS